MAWIESHTNLDRHSKLIRFQTAMRWSRNEAVGFLHRFWWSVLEVSPSGDVTALTLPEVMSETLNMKLDVVRVAIERLEEYGFIERNGERVFVHDWLDYAGRFLRSKFSKKREELVSIWALHGKVYGEKEDTDTQPTPRSNSTDTLPTRTLPNLTVPNQTVPDRTKPKDKDIGTDRPKFTKPTVDEIRDFIRSNRYDVDPGKFYDFYESNGWKVGRNQMRDWKATVRNWDRNKFQKGGQNDNKNSGGFGQRPNGSAPREAGSKFDGIGTVINV